MYFCGVQISQWQIVRDIIQNSRFWPQKGKFFAINSRFSKKKTLETRSIAAFLSEIEINTIFVVIGIEIGIYYFDVTIDNIWPCWRLTVQFLYSPGYDKESKRLIMVACEKQPEWDEVGNGWGWCRGHQHHCWRPISPQLSQRSLTYADTPLFDSCIPSNRLSCSVSYICILKQINPNVKQLSWAMN